MIRICLVAGLLAASAMSAQAAVLSSPAKAVPEASTGVDLAQYSRGSSRAFRRCMRDKYGPRYFQGVRRAQRFIMAQACGG